MRTSRSSSSIRHASLAGLAVLLIATLIGCQQPLAPSSKAPDYTINGPGTPPAVDAALQNQPPVAVPIAGQTNLLRNPDLENFTGNNPDNWVACAPNALLPSSDAASGLKAVLIAQNRSCLYQSAQITPGQSLNLTCQAKLVQDQGWTGWGLTFYNASFQKIGEAPTRRITSPTYEQYDTSATAPANAAYATAWAYSEGQMLLDKCSLTVADPAIVGDLLVNGGFEGNLTNWTNCNDASLISISTQAQSGARALRLAQNGCAYQNTELKPNHEYELTCQAKVTGNRYTEISLVYMDANWKTIIRKGTQVTASSYSSSTVRLITPANMVRSAVALYSQSDEAMFDTCSLKDTGLEIISSEYTKGKWSDVQAWPLLAIHASLLPTGEVLAWDSNNDDIETNSLPEHPFKPTRATLWNPITNAFISVNSNTGKDLFCAGHTVLANGNVIAAGGNQVPGNGQHNAISIFNPSNNTWTRGPDMAANRWYPSVTNLANGDALITSGGPSIPEVYSSTGTLRKLTGADLGQALYPWMQLAPNGKVVHFGPETTLRSLDTNGTGGWTTLGTRDSSYRDYGSYAMFAPGKVLVTGGAASLKTTQIVDVNNGLNTSSAAAMNFGRRQHNLTLLPNGSALANGGISNGAALVDVNAAVFATEVWNPNANRWDVMDSEKIPRQYHATTLLLPDGRILSAGGGFCGACPLATYFNKNAQIFSPTYLFNKDGTPAARPSITSAPASAAYASGFAVTTNTDIARVTLIAPSSVTHSVNMNQRFMELAFTKSGNNLAVTAPANANLAPPGTYMLFVLDAQGVPSVAKMLKVQ
jgi:Domain of unknown function (DUF1929)/Carbohydrate binding domain/Kelch motif